MRHPIILVPAYGRKYQTEKAMIDDYIAGKDFRVLSGAYCSCRDFKNQTISLSFGNGRYILYKMKG